MPFIHAGLRTTDGIFSPTTSSEERPLGLDPASGHGYHQVPPLGIWRGYVVLHLDSVSHGMNNSYDFNALLNDFGFHLVEDWHAISEDLIASRPSMDLFNDPEAAYFGSLQSWPEEMARAATGEKSPSRELHQFQRPCSEIIVFHGPGY